MSHSTLFLLYLPITMLLPATLSWYVGRSVIGSFATSRAALYTTIGVMFAVGLSASLALIFWSERDRTPIRQLVSTGFYAMGYLLTAAALMLTRDLLRLIWWLATCARRAAPAVTGRANTSPATPTLPRGEARSPELVPLDHDVSAAKPLPSWVVSAITVGQVRIALQSSGWLLLLAALVCLLLGRRGAEQMPTVHRVTIPIRELPAAFAGYRIAQLTDIHIHGSGDRERIRRLVSQVNDIQADLVAITGDVVDGPLDNLRAGLEPLGAIRARDGVYLALGNHENYADADACVAEFERLGFRVLLNESRVLNRGLDRLTIAGVTNPQRGMHGAKYTALQGRVATMRSDPRAAMAGAPVGVPKILLAHQPKSVFEARGLGFDLALAGHTHGGQFFPWNLAARLVFPYTAGLVVDGSMQVYVSRGIGTFGPPLRLGAAPEIPVFELRDAGERR